MSAPPPLTHEQWYRAPDGKRWLAAVYTALEPDEAPPGTGVGVGVGAYLGALLAPAWAVSNGGAEDEPEHTLWARPDGTLLFCGAPLDWTTADLVPVAPPAWYRPGAAPEDDEDDDEEAA